MIKNVRIIDSYIVEYGGKMRRLHALSNGSFAVELEYAEFRIIDGEEGRTLIGD